MPGPLTLDNLSDTVSRHMRPSCTWLYVDKTVGEVLDWLRQNPPEDRIIYFYVVDKDKHLIGVLPTRRLLLSLPDRPLSEIMIRQVVALPAHATVLEACEFFIQYRLLAFPVVDEERRLVGVVDVELYTDELAQLGEGSDRDDLFQLIGVHLAQAQQASPATAFRTRFPWLVCNLAGGILAAFLAGLYEEELSRVVALALFIPVVLALAESVSIQSVSLALQAMHGRPPAWKEMARRLRHELSTGLLLGSACGSVIAAVALLWLGQLAVAFCLLGGIAGGVTVAAFLGLAVPFFLRILRREPQVAAGPLALAASDALPQFRALAFVSQWD